MKSKPESGTSSSMRALSPTTHSGHTSQISRPCSTFASTCSGLSSTPVYLRPIMWATTPLTEPPAKGSMTRSPSRVYQA